MRYVQVAPSDEAGLPLSVNPGIEPGPVGSDGDALHAHVDLRRAGPMIQKFQPALAAWEISGDSLRTRNSYANVMLWTVDHFLAELSREQFDFRLVELEVRQRGDGVDLLAGEHGHGKC